jgi:tetratricopeptide (TPR) repeat protein/predicted Ser/Thr protein kinase
MTPGQLTLRFARGADTDDPFAEGRANARAAARLFGDAVPPSIIADRYAIAEPLGRGGSGVVYAATDLQLERRVAIKLIHPSEGMAADASARLAREARVLARLSHPNVVTVFDLGVMGDRIYVAMELVEGCNLATWLHERARPVAAILTAFEAAGRGLMAAHDHGIVHRDFKPNNVVITNDGAVKVLDFGLARLPAMAGASPGADGTSVAADDAITDDRIAVGTPRYMSPEQHCGHALDARSDLYSFCVALYEALYGALPWDGMPDLSATTACKQAWVPELARRPGVPSRVRMMLRRGLAATPQMRPASMAEVLEVLRPRPGPRRLALAAFGGAVVATAAGGLLWAGSPRAPPPCARAGEGLEDLWNDDARAEVLGRLGGAEADVEAANNVVARIDRWADGWSRMRTESCIATRVDESQSSEMLDRREACLRTRRAELSQLLAIPGDGVPVRVSQLSDGLDALAPIDECASDRLLERGDAHALGPAARERDIQIAEARVLVQLGQHAAAETKLDAIFRALSEAPDPRRRARALFVRAQLANDHGDIRGALVDLEEATIVAEEGGDPLDRANAWARLGHMHGALRQEIARAEHDLAIAEAIAGSLARAEREHAAVASARSQVLVAAGRFDEALPAALAALEQTRGISDDESRLAAPLTSLGVVYGKLGRWSEAEASFAEALAVYERYSGGSSPNVVMVLDNLGACARALGRLELAAERYGRALRIAEHALAPDHFVIADLFANLARLESERGDLDAARTLLVRAVEIAERAHGRDSAVVGHKLVSLAAIHHKRGERAAARSVGERALAIYRDLESPPPREVAVAEFNLASAIVDDDRARAVALARSALARADALDPASDDRREIAQWLGDHGAD